VLKRVGVWVAKKVWSFLGWLGRKVGSIVWKYVLKPVWTLVSKTVRVWVSKIIKIIVKSRIWKEAKKFVKKIVKKSVDKIKKVAKKIWKKIQERRKGKVRKKEKPKSSGPTPELVAIGKNREIGPQVNRPSDYERDGDDVLPQNGKPKPIGQSTYDTEENLKKHVGGYMWRLPEGTVLPEGLSWVKDDDPKGHHTIYANRRMPFEEYKAKIEGLPWEPVKRVKKDKAGGD